MKNFRASALLLVGVIALFGWLWWREREPALPPGVQVVARFAPAKITRIVLKNQGQPALQLQKEGADWKIAPQVLAGQKGAKTAVFADTEKVSEFLDAFAVLRSDVVLPAAKNDEYGLDEPRASVELDGQNITFGTPPFFDAQRVYARVDDKIVLLPRTLSQATARPLDAWRDHNIARFEIANIKSISLNNGAEKIGLMKMGSTEVAPAIGGENWIVNGPVFEPADSEKIVALLQMLQAAQVKKFLEIGSGNWGFDKPMAQMSFDDGAPILTVGRKIQNGYVAYGRVKDAPFIVGEDVAQMLREPVDSWRSHRLLSFDLNAITRVNLRARGQNLVYVREGARWHQQGANATTFDESAAAIADILVAVRDWRASDFLYPSESGQAIFRLGLPEAKGARGVEIWRVGNQWRARVLGLPNPPRPIYVLPESAMTNLNALLDRLLAPTPTPAPARVGPHL